MWCARSENIKIIFVVEKYWREFLMSTNGERESSERETKKKKKNILDPSQFSMIEKLTLSKKSSRKNGKLWKFKNIWISEWIFSAIFQCFVEKLLK